MIGQLLNRIEGTKMRYLSLLAAILASTPVWAQYTDTIEIPPGFTGRWQAPRPFVNALVGDPNAVEAEPDNDQQLTIFAKPEGGTTNIVLRDGNGAQVANVLITNPAIQYQPARNANTGELQLYRNDDKCYPICVRLPKPNDRVPTKRIKQ
jgi:Flp pilus assembly secretin CpaC